MWISSERRKRREARRQFITLSVSAGIQYFSGIPLPLNQNTKRDPIALAGSFADAAYAHGC
jgi:hypothetical protein